MEHRRISETGLVLLHNAVQDPVVLLESLIFGSGGFIPIRPVEHVPQLPKRLQGLGSPVTGSGA